MTASDPHLRTPKSKGPRNLVIGCGVLSLLLIVGVAGVFSWFYSNVESDPVKVRLIAQEMLSGVEAPDGFTFIVGVRLLGSKAVTLRDAKSENEIEIRERSLEKGEAVTVLAGERRGEDGNPATSLGVEKFSVLGRETEFQKMLIDDRIELIGVVHKKATGRVCTIVARGTKDVVSSDSLRSLLASVTSVDAAGATPGSKGGKAKTP